MGLLALGMCYVLLLANGNADFGAPTPKPLQAPWPQPRQSVPGWLSLHLSFLERLSDSGSSQVCPQSKQFPAAQSCLNQLRQDVPCWLSVHLSFLERLSDGGSSQVWFSSGQMSATDLIL